MLERLQLLHRQGLITALDLHFAQFITQLAAADAESAEPLTLAALLASHETGNGNICVNLPALAGQTVLGSDVTETPWRAPQWPDWRHKLQATTVVGRPQTYRPLILDEQGRLYLYRYWDYEQRLSKNLLQRAVTISAAVDEARLSRDLAHLFPPGRDDFTDWQKIAATTAVLRHFCVISGGPGTGKTTTVMRILTLLLSQNPHLRIGLVAPTGKAAARMQDAIRDAKQQLDLPVDQQVSIPEQASTIHRLLKPRPHSVYFQHNQDNPLALDVLVVDEASMVDLALMTKLVEALPPHARLLLLGDKDQLASVEAGAVLGDICGSGGGFSPPFRQRLHQLTDETLPPADQQHAPLADSIVLLRHSYRFGDDAGIGALAKAVNQGAGKQALKLLQHNEFADVSWQEVANLSELQERLVDAVVAGYDAYLQALRSTQGIDERIFKAFDRFRVLCALRNGPCGVDELNRLLETELHRRRLLRIRDHWYHGRPVMVTRNDYNLRLYNGDIGIALHDPSDGGRLKVFFPGNDGVLRRIPPTRLPEHETCYAMTVHKSQGSEFEHVLLLVPLEQSRILSRELLYTGITRARSRVELWSKADIFSSAVSRRLQRVSGLRDSLWPKK